mmetsp:Transcript_98356/g.175125  ORF Transcript_98356/g.175125 Transcript_98356/m.175125 type:complete len:233 (-) Transcript_98356:831-1529(-)
MAIWELSAGHQLHHPTTILLLTWAAIGINCKIAYGLAIPRNHVEVDVLVPLACICFFILQELQGNAKETACEPLNPMDSGCIRKIDTQGFLVNSIASLLQTLCIKSNVPLFHVIEGWQFFSIHFGATCSKLLELVIILLCRRPCYGFYVIQQLVDSIFVACHLVGKRKCGVVMKFKKLCFALSKLQHLLHDLCIAVCSIGGNSAICTQDDLSNASVLAIHEGGSNHRSIKPN